MALSAKIYMRPPATIGETNTFAPSGVVLATWPLLASTATSEPSVDTTHSLPPARTGPFQRAVPGSCVIQRTLPSPRASAMSLPFTSTTKTASPADHGICVLVTFLAMLELAKEQLLDFVQEAPLAPIYLKSLALNNNNEPLAFSSEFDDVDAANDG